MPKRSSNTETTPKRPGAFMPDGSFNEDGGWAQQGPAHALVASLVRQRRSGKITPSDAAALIYASRADGAFPSVDQWASCGPWPACWTQTSSEEAVKRAGLGTGGHWCGQSWAAGAEKDCDDERHRGKPSRSDVEATISVVLQHVANAPPLPVRRKATPPEQSGPGAGETYPGWQPQSCAP